MAVKPTTMTQGKPLKTILLFTLPLLVGNIFQQFYNMADTFIVGRTIGVNALAAVGCTGPLTFLILGFAQGATGGFSVITAQYYGAGDGNGVRRSFLTGLLLSMGVSVVLTAASVPLARTVLGWMNTPQELMADATDYLVVIFWGIAVSMLFNHLSGAIRALGDSRTPLVFLVVACIANIVLDYVLILWFGMGVMGAAVATVAAQLLASTLCILFILKKMPILVRHAHLSQITGEECVRHLRIGIPMGFQASIIAVGAIVLQTALNGLGAVSVAAYTAAGKVDQFATMPLGSLGLGVGTFTAQNYGARRLDRIRAGVLQSTAASVLYSVVMGVVMLLFGDVLVTPFVGRESQQIIQMAQIYLSISGCSYFILSILFNTRCALQGLGLSLAPTFAGVMELVMRSAAALLLARYFGFTGACFAGPLAWLGAAIPLTVTFLKTMRRLTAYQKANPIPALGPSHRDRALAKASQPAAPSAGVIELGTGTPG